MLRNLIRTTQIKLFPTREQSADNTITVMNDSLPEIIEDVLAGELDRYRETPTDYLPPYIKQVSGFGERTEWTHDVERILFVEKPIGQVYELDSATGQCD